MIVFIALLLVVAIVVIGIDNIVKQDRIEHKYTRDLKKKGIV